MIKSRTMQILKDLVTCMRTGDNDLDTIETLLICDVTPEELEHTFYFSHDDVITVLQKCYPSKYKSYMNGLKRKNQNDSKRVI